MRCSNEKAKRFALTLQLPWFTPADSPYATTTTHLFGNGGFESWGWAIFTGINKGNAPNQFNSMPQSRISAHITQRLLYVC